MGANTNQAGVSVIVCTYEQEWMKLKMTLDSIICQKGVDVELIITDDGSVINHHDQVVRYLQKKSFTAYKFIHSEINTGIVKNTIRGLSACCKQYIKLISPGDCFLENDTLCLWVTFLRESGKRWSFADVVPYKNEGGVLSEVDVEEHPRLKEDYKKGVDELSRWNYVVLNDIAVGAATIVEFDLFREYLMKIDNRVVYAEDNIYRLMMYDGVVGAYYPKGTVLYEVGCGISTRGEEEWDKLISKDWSETNKIMKETYNSNDPIHRKVFS